MKPPATAQGRPQQSGKSAGVTAGAPTPQPAEAGADGAAAEGEDSHTETTGASAGQSVPPMFGAALEPVLREECAGRLSGVSWFRTDWQRGGALTGYAAYTHEDGTQDEVVVKLPVPPRERSWLVRLSENGSAASEARSKKTSAAPGPLPGAGGVTPRVFAHGEALNGYDLAWVVMEKLPHGPLGVAWEGREFDLLVEAAGRFYAAADATPLPEGAKPEPRDWDDLLRRAREKVKAKDWPNGQAWKQALKKSGKQLDRWAEAWEARPVTGWCHGDLHLGNAMSRHAAELAEQEDTDAVLLDLANVRPGHWLEDAVYAEHLYWSRRDRLGGRKLVSLVAKARKTHGLSVGDDWSPLAETHRRLVAMASPVTIAQHGGGTAYLDAALALLA